MKVIRLIQLFFLLSIILIIGELFSIAIIRLLARVVLVPTLFLIYYKSVEKVNPIVIPVFLFSYLGDISTYFDYSISFKASIVLFGISHIYLAIIAFTLIKEKSIKRLLLYAIPIIILWLVYYEYYLYETFGTILGSLYPYVLGYTIALGVLNILANVSFFNEGSKLTLYLIVIAVSIVVGNVLLCIYIFASPIHIFKVVNVISHVFAYFFILKFTISYSKYKFKPSLV